MSEPAPYRSPMNWEERARRAEALADLLYARLQDLIYAGTDDPTPEECDALDALDGAALDAWAAHRADLDTLDGAAQE